MKKMPAGNERFGVRRGVAHGHLCGNLEVYRPHELYWKPRLRKAAGTLYDIGAKKIGI
jgi:hypothetical protein